MIGFVDEDEGDRSRCWQVEDEEEEEEVEDVAHTCVYTGCRLLIKTATEMWECVCVCRQGGAAIPKSLVTMAPCQNWHY